MSTAAAKVHLWAMPALAAVAGVIKPNDFFKAESSIQRYCKKISAYAFCFPA
ncbi:MAG: hypothetical protein ACXV9U_12740 [Methylobacter sp.]